MLKECLAIIILGYQYKNLNVKNLNFLNFNVTKL